MKNLPRALWLTLSLHTGGLELSLKLFNDVHEEGIGIGLQWERRWQIAWIVTGQGWHVECGPFMADMWGRREKQTNDQAP